MSDMATMFSFFSVACIETPSVIDVCVCLFCPPAFFSDMSESKIVSKIVADLVLNLVAELQ